MIVACPTCKKTIEWNDSARWRPFCSERCRLIDLGEWISEQHAISDPEEPADFPAPDPDYPTDY